MKEALLYEAKEKNVVRCTACKQFCTVADGDTGLCGVRQNLKGKLYLLVYGKAASAGIDPIEKKPLYHFLPGSKIFSLGTVGCNFACSFCQNWSISQVTRDLRKQLQNEKKPELMEVEINKMGYELSPERIVDICQEKNVKSIAYTYNEPAIFLEYAHDTSQLASKHDVRGVFVTNGYESEEALMKMKGLLHAMNIDLKSFSDAFYKEMCQARLEPVLETIKLAYKMGIWLEITTLLVPGKNDSPDELKQIAEFIAGIDKGIPWHISAFHPDYKLADVLRTSRGSLESAYDIGKGAGLHHIYVGNVVDEKRNTTYCPECGAGLIRRSGYSLTVEDFEHGNCMKCNAKVPGVWV